MIFEILFIFMFFAIRIINFENFNCFILILILYQNCVNFILILCYYTILYFIKILYYIKIMLIFFIPQSTTFTPFFTPIPATWHFSLFGFSPENKENSSRVFKAPITDFLLLKKKLLSSPYVVCKNYDHKYLNL